MWQAFVFLSWLFFPVLLHMEKKKKKVIVQFIRNIENQENV